MSYVNQDPDLFTVPFKGHNIVQTPKRAWLEELSASASCWCGAEPGSCPDCQDCDAVAMQTSAYHAGKVNIGSGEDANMFR